ncbi:MAG: hypothetical protein K6T86_04145 [Pirellulales bacterium]|nr:hypothetical protein [Pirellulales bacterium]
MNVSYRCPACERPARAALAAGAEVLACPRCGHALRLPAGAWEGGRVNRCLTCPSQDLYVRKDFSQRLGVAIVLIGFAASCVTWHFYYVTATFGILLGTFLADALLYVLVGECLVCYACRSEYRGVEGVREHGRFSLETFERYRQQAARLRQRRAPHEEAAETRSGQAP